MKPAPAFAMLVVACALVAGASAQPPTFTFLPRPEGNTVLTMGVDVANGIIAAAAGSRVRVPPFERVILLMPERWPYPIQWLKDGRAIEGATGRSFVIPFATTVDTGRYDARGAPFPTITTGIALEIVAAGHVGNFSTRAELTTGALQTIGFVVGGTSPKSLLIRAVGPSLRPFNLPRPVAQPRFKIFDAAGREINFVHPAVVVDLPAFFTSVGAFPLIAGAGDAVDYGEFRPGAYTVLVGEQSSQGGTVLNETYEFSTGPAPASVAIVPGG